MNATITSTSAALFAAFVIAGQEYASARQKFAVAMAKEFPVGMAFDAYTKAAKAWREAYQVTKSCDDAAAQKAFERAVDAMNSYLADIDAEKFVRPKATTADAVKKAEARKAEQDKVEALIASAKPADLAKKAQSGDKLAAKAVAAIASKARADIEAKHGEMLKAIRSELKNATPDALKQIAGILGIKS